MEMEVNTQLLIEWAEYHEKKALEAAIRGDVVVAQDQAHFAKGLRETIANRQTEPQDEAIRRGGE